MSSLKNEQQLSLFQPDFAGVVPAKDQQDLMTYPFFSLSKQKRTTPIKYDDGRVKITVTGHQDHGIANIYDADILIYVASQIMEARNKGLETSRRIQISRYDILEFLGKGTGGNRYKRLEESLERLQSTSVRTTIREEDSRYKVDAMFSWIERWSAVTKNGRPIAIEFYVDEWFYQGIVQGKVLTLPRSYFRVESGFERFLYKLCRKTVGNTRDGQLWMKLETVHKRSGMTRKPGAFRKMIELIVEAQSVPDYWIFLMKRPVTGDWYVTAASKAYYKTRLDAYESIDFFDADRLMAERAKQAKSID